MSRRRVYSVATIAVMDRFFVALESCRAHKILKVCDYCDDNGILACNLYRQRKDRTRGYFEIGWCVPLVEKYGISALWLLTGLGAMYSPKGREEYDSPLPV